MYDHMHKRLDLLTCSKSFSFNGFHDEEENLRVICVPTLSSTDIRNTNYISATLSDLNLVYITYFPDLVSRVHGTQTKESRVLYKDLAPGTHPL